MIARRSGQGNGAEVLKPGYPLVASSIPIRLFDIFLVKQFAVILSLPIIVRCFRLALLPVHVDSLQAKVQELHSKLVEFMEENVYPAEQTFRDHSQSQDKWSPHPQVEELKVSDRYLVLYT